MVHWSNPEIQWIAQWKSVMVSSSRNLSEILPRRQLHVDVLRGALSPHLFSGCFCAWQRRLDMVRSDWLGNSVCGHNYLRICTDSLPTRHSFLLVITKSSCVNLQHTGVDHARDILHILVLRASRDRQHNESELGKSSAVAREACCKSHTDPHPIVWSTIYAHPISARFRTQIRVSLRLSYSGHYIFTGFVRFGVVLLRQSRCTPSNRALSTPATKHRRVVSIRRPWGRSFRRCIHHQ